MFRQPSTNLYAITRLDVVGVSTVDPETQSILEQAAKQAVEMTAENNKLIVRVCTWLLSKTRKPGLINKVVNNTKI